MRSTPMLPLLLAVALLGCADRSALAEASAPRWTHADLAPFVLTLSGGPQADGELELVATVELLRPLAAPLLITVALPPGASLLSGDTREVIASPRPGTVSRTFRVRDPGHETVMVEASQLIPGRAGARASRRFPAEPPHSPPRWRTIDEVRLGGVPIREAVSIDRPQER